MTDAPHTPLHTLSHMSPAQAAQVADVSRWTIMRAIKSRDLQASRDNRNQWRIASDALEAWRAHTVRTPRTPKKLSLSFAKSWPQRPPVQMWLKRSSLMSARLWPRPKPTGTVGEQWLRSWLIVRAAAGGRGENHRPCERRYEPIAALGGQM